MLASVSASELDMDWIHLWIAMSRMTVTQFCFSYITSILTEKNVQYV